jgi:hypothetical protein
VTIKTEAVNFALVMLTMLCVSLAHGQCPPINTTKDSLLALREQDFAIVDSVQRQAFAIQLIPCLQSLDPVLRDEIAFEAYSHWMRDKALSTKTMTDVFSILMSWLPADVLDSSGVSKPFAILVLAEVVRVDRIDPFISSSQRQEIVNAVSQYLESITDYRGFDQTVGWRHGVAHSADLVLQLSLNENIRREQLEIMANAIVIQIAPKIEHFYLYGEGQRLARALFYLAQRDLMSEVWWIDWFTRLMVSEPNPELFQSQLGLARRHNLTGFLNAFYLYLSENGDKKMRDMFHPMILESIVKLG